MKRYHVHVSKSSTRRSLSHNFLSATTTYHVISPTIDRRSRYDIRDDDDRSAPSFRVGMR